MTHHIEITADGKRVFVPHPVPAAWTPAPKRRGFYPGNDARAAAIAAETARPE